ncbi:hypothetical protein Gotur_029625 [Gossypium turneri]
MGHWRAAVRRAREEATSSAGAWAECGATYTMFGWMYWHSQYTRNRWAPLNPPLIRCLVGCISITSQICSFPNTPGPIISIPPIQRRLENPYPFLIFVSFFCPHRFLLLLLSVLQICPHFFCFHNKSSTLSSSEADDEKIGKLMGIVFLEQKLVGQKVNSGGLYRLLQCASKGDKAGIIQELDKGVEPNRADYDTRTR